MRFASLGSGSRGNALLVEAGSTAVLVDCGFGPRVLAKRLARLGIEPDRLDAIVVTHEHADHIGGVARCARRYGLPVYLTHGTFGAASLADIDIRIFDSHACFGIGDLQLAPFPVPHDAREPVQFVVSDGVRRLGVLTDVGCATPHIVAMLSACHALILECNHDVDLLAAGTYPPHLKRRIAGRLGHLDNQSAAALLGRLPRAALQHVVAAHLSQENNTPQRARAALAAVLGCAPDWVAVADQEDGCGWRDLR